MMKGINRPGALKRLQLITCDFTLGRDLKSFLYTGQSVNSESGLAVVPL